MNVHRTALGVAKFAAVSALALSSCSSNVTETDAAPASSAHHGVAASTPPPTKDMPTPASTEVAVPAGVVGGGCAGYVQKVPSGPGSIIGMAVDPVAIAISNSPELTTLAGAVAGRLNPDVNLVETLNKGQYTVFAPTDAAFGKLPPEVLEKFRNDSGQLASVLKYHVVSGELDPSALAGDQKTLQGQTLKVSTSGDDDVRVNDVPVVCGGIKTANATVYLVDTVLMPPAPAPGTSGATTTGTSGATTTGESTAPDGVTTDDSGQTSGTDATTATSSATPSSTPSSTPTS